MNLFSRTPRLTAVTLLVALALAPVPAVASGVAGPPPAFQVTHPEPRAQLTPAPGADLDPADAIRGFGNATMGQGLDRLRTSDDTRIPAALVDQRSMAPQSEGRAATWRPPGIQGMDVSSHQGAVNWRRAKSQGAAFAYVKATEGTDYVNPFFAQQYDGAASVGMVRGAYHFAVPTRSSSGAEQAAYFVENGGGWSADGRTLPPLLDIEYNPYPSLGDTCYDMSAAQMVSWIRDFSSTVQDLTGRVPMIYTTTGWWTTCTGNSSAFADHPLHIAAYNRTTAGLLPGGWSSYAAWQYSSTGPFVGDSNVWQGSTAELVSFAPNAQATSAARPDVPRPGGVDDGDAG